MEGEANINGIVLQEGDAAKVEDEDLNVGALSNVHILLVEMMKV